MSRARKIGLGVLAFILLLLGMVGFLIGTEGGLHLLINGAARWVPGLEIAHVSGGWRGLTVTGLQYRMPGVTVRAEQFHLSLDPACLRHSQLCLDTLSLRDVDIDVKTAALAPSPTGAAEPQNNSQTVSTPYPLILRHLALNNVRIRIDDTLVTLGSLESGMDFRANSLTVAPTHIAGLLVALPKAAEVLAEQAGKQVGKQIVQTGQQKRQDAEAALEKARRQPSPEAAFKAFFAQPLLPDLPDVRLPLNVRLEGLRAEDLRLTDDTDILISALDLRGAVQDGQATLERLNIDSPQGLLNASGTARLSGSWPLNLTLNTAINAAPFKGEKIRLTLSGGLRDQLMAALNFSGPVKAQITLQTRPAEAGLPLTLTFNSPGMQWPLSGQPQYQARNLSLNLDGKAVDYTLTMGASLSGQGLPPAEVSLAGKGNTAQFTLSRLHIATLQGQGDITALVDWSNAVSWRSELTLSGINTAGQWPDWPARLDGKLSVLGSLHGGSWQLRVPELTLDGEVKQNRLTARGSLSGNAAGQWHVSALRLALGRNSLTVNGDLNNQLALDAVIDAPNLNGALPGLGGTITGSLNVRGDRQSPQVSANLTAAGLRWQELRIRRIALNGRLQSSDIIRGNLNVEIDQLQQATVNVRRLTLALTGDERAHQLRLNLQGEPVSGGLTLNGGYDRLQQRWRGTLSQTQFGSPVGEWRLSRPMTFDYQQQAQNVVIGPHCWQNINAQLCVPANIQLGAGGQATVLLNRFDLAMLKPFLPPSTTVGGVFSGRAQVSWQPGGSLPTARIVLTGNGVKVRQNIQGGVLPVDFDRVTFNAGLENDRATLDWQIGITGNGQFNGQVQVADPRNRRTLSGNVAMNNLSLALINPLLSGSEHAAGMLNANLRLGGNAVQPQLYGRLSLDRVIIRSNQLPFAMTESQLAMTFAGTSSALQGVIRTTSGQLNLSGNANWSRINAWNARIAARGNRVRITLPPMVRLDVSPDITVEAAPQALTLNGSVTIPWARIVVQKLPESAVAVSPDEVILDAQLQPVAEREAGMVINSNMKIHVGNDVRLDAFGLKARLQGDLNVIQDKQGLGLHGQIAIPYGRFNAYSQDLIIRRGLLIFAGPPTQPMLNIEAIRNPDSTADGVTAGVRVTGMADQPRIDVFTDPVKSQQEALSYLLRGQGLNTPGADSSMMTSMLIGMGVAQTGQLVGKIGAAFGVSNLTLDTQGVGDESQVVVSGYVTPGLQVKYGVGIYDSLATLTLRYRLMPRLYLEAVSGLNQALDLLYQFEF
ncbi:translocation/assembly module TamB domain-containing protein [Sodalis sp. dw_96]|uniref:autotransporter assembly complex protein TamB n=1 Tax=Sodalis sp. dw_96 TaxID=2719794 RepID=UPI001BD1DC2D|nr:translocation/assembly module TamB domain-containing protein [Sodalis sp. dw_96]